MANWAHERAHEGVADLLPQPRDEDDVRVEAQWQEHVCRSNLVSGVSARVEGRGRGAVRELAFWRWAAQAGAGVLAGCGVPQLLFHPTYIEITKTPSGRQCPGDIP